jgi:NADPH:quinone reductase-like Zn-dependent oxidoreductase
VDYGPFSRPVPPVPLADVTGVAVAGGWLGRRLGVGCVVVRAGDREVRLKGVRHPGLFAEKVRVAAARARKAAG